MREVAAFCRKWNMIPAGGTVLCAVSGGRDSMALLHLLCELSRQKNFSVAAAHFNHHLRPTAQRDESFVRTWCEERGIPCFIGGGDVAAFAAAEGRSIEDAARVLRYRFLEKTADAINADRIATAHHLQDNAETLLLHLMRGTGLQGLTGIAPVRGRIIRPLLETDRAEIDRYITKNHIPFVEDETNQDTAFTRNRVRLEVLPLLEEMAPGCTKRMAETAALLREEESHLQQEVEKLVPEECAGQIVLPVPVLHRQDVAVVRRLVRRMGQVLGVELNRSQTEHILQLKSGGFLDLPQGICALRKPHQLILCRRTEAPEPMELQLGCWTWGRWRVTVVEGELLADGVAHKLTLPAYTLTGPLTIGIWDGTGRFAVENGSRTIKRLFADRGIPVEKREEHPALFLAGRPVAVFGVGVDRSLWLGEDDDRITVILEQISEKEKTLPRDRRLG